MKKALSHRGPDGHGEYFCTSKQAALAHTRLSIIDLTDRAQQPMQSTDNRFSITFNGEIYNYQALRARLEAEGQTFNSNSDTEVILKMYASKGAQCVHFLRGMFAFVIWDKKKKTAFAARDPLGIKPLYYWRDKQSLAFASELRAVIASGMSAQRISSNALTSYFLRGTVAEPNTMLSDVKMLPAGATLTWRNGKTRIKHYWKLKFKPQKLSYERAVSLTRQALEGSIRAHLVADVPVGIFLSGGIDSTILVALTRKLTTKKINTYSIVFNNPEWNEGQIANRTAKHFGTNHTEFLMTPELAKSLFTEFLKDIDQPTIDGFNTYCIAKFASEQGEKVVLTGLGADELFAGYKSFQMLPEMLNKSQRFQFLSFAVKPLSKIATIFLSPRLRRIADALASPLSITAAHQSLRGIFSNAEALALTKKITHKPAKLPALKTPEALEVSDQISELELTTYMRNQLLRDSDVTSMAWGLELRVPFIDKVFIEQLCTIPADMRLQQGKKLLINAVPELPDWVLERPKQGFHFPFNEWLSESWQVMPLYRPPKWIGLKPWYRYWSMSVLYHWKQRYAQ